MTHKTQKKNKWKRGIIVSDVDVGARHCYNVILGVCQKQNEHFKLRKREIELQ